MKEIMKALCGLWKEEWQGMVMGQLNYEKGEGAGLRRALFRFRLGQEDFESFCFWGK